MTVLRLNYTDTDPLAPILLVLSDIELRNVLHCAHAGDDPDELVDQLVAEAEPAPPDLGVDG